MSTSLNSDIIIAGAGPAGAATSLFLCKNKIPHIIIDKAKFPRDKICGDALSGKVVEVMQKLNPALLDKLYNDKNLFLGSYGVKFAAPNSRFIDIPFKIDLSQLKNAPGFIAKRIHFDNFLFQQIDRQYATVIEGATIKDIQYTIKGVDIHYEQDGIEKSASCKILVGAEGDRSIVAKKLAHHAMEAAHYCGGLRAYYKGVTNFHPQDFIELHFIKELLPGYFWVFPLPNGEANVGVGMLTKSASKKKVNLKQTMLKAIAENPTLRDRFKNAELIGDIKGWGLPLGSKKRKLSGRNFLLTGDAASLIDPFTGEGIGNAMMSGMIAAEHIKKVLPQNKFDEQTMAAYDKAIYARFWDELKLSHTLQKLTNYGWLFNLVVNKAAKNKTMRDTMTIMLDSLEARSKLRDPWRYAKLLFRY